MTDMPITHTHIPPFPTAIFPSGRISFYVKDDLYGKIAGKSKKTIWLYSWKLYAKYYDERRYRFNKETKELETL
jgi:hypothetical protein